MGRAVARPRRDDEEQHDARGRGWTARRRQVAHALIHGGRSAAQTDIPPPRTVHVPFSPTIHRPARTQVLLMIKSRVSRALPPRFSNLLLSFAHACLLWLPLCKANCQQK